GELAILEPAKGTVAGVVKVGAQPHWLAVSSDGRTAYVANEGSNDLSGVDLGRRAVTATIAVGNAPRKVAVQPGPAAAAGPAPASGGAAAAAPPVARTIRLGDATVSDHGSAQVEGRR